jgi:parallel beta-helix repeat protein
MPSGKLAFPRKSLVLLVSIALLAVLLAAFSMGGAQAAGPTVITGDITTDTTWTYDNSPYIVDNTVTVLPDVTLTIEPGVTVMCGDNLIIAGTLNATGTEANPIIFTYDPAVTTFWNGIIFDTTSVVSTFDYVMIDNATVGVWITDAAVPITNCHFENCQFGVVGEFANVDSVFTVTGCHFRNVWVSVQVSVEATAFLTDDDMWWVPITISDNYLEDSNSIVVSRYAESNDDSLLTLLGAVTITNNVMTVGDPALNGINYVGGVNSYGNSYATLGGDVTISDNNISPFNATLGSAFADGIYVERNVGASDNSAASMESAFYIFDNNIAVTILPPGPTVYPVRVLSEVYSELTCSASLVGNVEIYTNEILGVKQYGAIFYDLKVDASGESTANVGSELWVINNEVTNCTEFLLVNYDGIVAAETSLSTLSIGVVVTGNVVTGATWGMNLLMSPISPADASSILLTMPVTVTGNTILLETNGYGVNIDVHLIAGGTTQEMTMSGDVVVSGNSINTTDSGRGINIALTVLSSPSAVDSVNVAGFLGNIYVENNVIYKDANNWGYDSSIAISYFAYAYNSYDTTMALATFGSVVVRGNSLTAGPVDTFTGVDVDFDAFAQNYGNGTADAIIGDLTIEYNTIAVDSQWSNWDMTVYGVDAYAQYLYTEASDGAATLVAGSFVVAHNDVSLLVSNVTYAGLCGTYLEVDNTAGGPSNCAAIAYGTGHAFTMIGDIMSDFNAVDITAWSIFGVTIRGIECFGGNVGASVENYFVNNLSATATVTVGDVSASENTLGVDLTDDGWADVQGIYSEVYYFAEGYGGAAEFTGGSWSVSNNDVVYMSTDITDYAQQFIAIYLYTDDIWSGSNYNGTSDLVYGDVKVDGNTITATMFGSAYWTTNYYRGIYEYIQYASVDAYWGNSTLFMGDVTATGNDVTFTLDYQYTSLEIYGIQLAETDDMFYAYSYGPFYSAAATYGSFLCDENRVTITSTNESYQVNFHGIEWYVYDFYAEAYNSGGGLSGEALVIAGDFSCSNNEVYVDVSNSYDAYVVGVAMYLYYIDVNAYNGNAAMMVGDIVMDGNVVRVTANYVSYVGVTAQDLYIYDMYAYSSYGNATLIAGDFSVSGNEGLLETNHTSTVGFDGAYLGFYNLYASNEGNWTAMAIYGAILMQDNTEIVSSEDMNDSNFSFYGVYLYIDYAYADAEGSGPAPESVATRMCGDVLMTGNTVAAAYEDGYDDDVFGVYLESYYTYVEADNGIAASVWGNFDMGSNDVTLEVTDNWVLDAYGVYMYVYDMYADASNGGYANLAAGNFTANGNKVRMNIDGNTWYTNLYCVELYLYYFYAQADNSEAMAAFGDVAVNDSEVTISAVDSYSINVEAADVYLEEMYADADNGALANVFFGDLSISDSVVAIDVDDIDGLGVYGAYLYVYDGYAEADNSDASSTFGNFDANDNIVTLVADSMSSSTSIDGVYLYIYDLYASSYYGNASVLAGDVNTNGNTVLIEENDVYNLSGLDGVMIYVEDIYAESYGNWTAQSTWGSFSQVDNAVDVTVAMNDDWYMSSEIDPVSIEVEYAYADANANSDGTECMANFVMGSFTVDYNNVQVSLTNGGIYLDFDGVYSYLYEVYADADYGASASAEMGDFSMSNNVVNLYSDEVSDVTAFGVYSEFYELYADAYYAAADFAFGEYSQNNNAVNVTVDYVDDEFYVYGVYFYVDDMGYAYVEYNGTAISTLGSFSFDDNTVIIYCGEVYEAVVYGLYAEIYYLYAEVDYGGEWDYAEVTVGDFTACGNDFDITICYNDHYYGQTDVSGLYLYVYEAYAEGYYNGNAAVTCGNIQVDNNDIMIRLDHSSLRYYDAEIYGIEVYIEEFYAYAYNGNVSFTMGDITQCNNVVNIVVDYGCDVDMYGLYLYVYDLYAYSYGFGEVSATYGNFLVEHNTVNAVAEYMDYYYSNADVYFYGIEVEYEEAYAYTNGWNEEIPSSADFVSGDISVHANTVSYTGYEAGYTYIEAMYLYFYEMYAYADGGPATRTMGVIFIDNNDVNIYVDENYAEVRGIYAEVEYLYAEAYSGSTAIAVYGTIDMADNTVDYESDNLYDSYGYNDWGPMLYMYVYEPSAWAYDEGSIATATFGDILVIYNTVNMDYVEDMYGIYLDFEYFTAEAETQATATVTMGYLNVTGNKVSSSEEAYYSYGIYIYFGEVYAYSSEDSTAQAICEGFNVLANEVYFAYGYECYGLYFDDYWYYIYAEAEYGGSATFSFVDGFNLIDNTVTMDMAEESYGIYVYGVWAYSEASFGGAVSTLDLATTMTDNTVTMTAESTDYDDNTGFDVEVYCYAYYDEGFATFNGGFLFENNVATLVNDDDGEAIYLYVEADMDEDSNNGVGVLVFPICIQDNTASGGYYAFYLEYIETSVTAQIVNNAASDAIYGFYLYEVYDIEFAYNTIDNCEYGLTVYYAYTLTVENIVFTGCDDGASFEYVEDLVFTNNVVSNNEDDGFYLYDGFNVTITYNEFNNNGDDAVDIDYVVNLLFADNEVLNNVYYGFYLDDGFNCTVTDNIFNGNEYGGYFEDSAALFVEDNSFDENDYGLYMYYCGYSDEEYVIVGNNTFNYNLYDGLYAYDCDYLTIYNSEFIDNGDSAIEVYDGYMNKWIVDVYAEVKNGGAEFDGIITICPDATMVLNFIDYFYIGNNYEAGIDVLEGATLKATNVWFDGNYNWFFNVYGTLRMIDGGVEDGKGLYLGPTAEVSIDTARFYDLNDGIIIDGCSPRISGCTIEYSDDGINIINGAAPVIKGCLIYSNERGIYSNGADLMYVVDNIIMDNYYGIYAENTQGKIHDNVLLMN